MGHFCNRAATIFLVVYDGKAVHCPLAGALILHPVPSAFFSGRPGWREIGRLVALCEPPPRPAQGCPVATWNWGQTPCNAWTAPACWGKRCNTARS
eukprot:4010802-Pyramimonas_sp.AAC.1